MRLMSLAALTAGLILVAPASGWSQARVRIGVNAGQQVSSTRFEQAGSFTDFLEDATFTGAHEIDAGVFYEGNVTARIAGAFTAGLAVSVFSRDDTVDVRAGLPHPFFFNRPRGVSGAPGGLERRETGVHILLGWLLPATDGVEIMVTAGPSIFKVEQDFVERVNYTHAYPFDDAQFTGVATERISDNAIGFNAGADVSINLSTNVGVGLLIRYSRGTLDAPSAAGNTVSFDVGGLHAGGGLRLRF